MAKNPYLTPEIKQLIGQIYLKNHRLIGVTKARNELLKQMKEKGLDKIFGSNYPSISTVCKELKKLQEIDAKRPPEVKDLDKPWSVATLVKYPISPEALPLVILAWVQVLKEGFELSIREALWVGRLYRTANTNNMDNAEIARWLSIVTLEYSDLERLAEITGLPYLPSYYRDLELYEEMTGQEISPDIEQKIKSLIKETPEIELFKAKYKGEKGGKNK